MKDKLSQPPKMFGWISNFFKTRKDKRDPTLLAAVEQAVDGTDPRLRVVRGYQGKLLGAVSHAWQYADSLASRVPGPIEMRRRAFSADPRVGAFFASADSLQHICSGDREMREFFKRDDNFDVDEVYALLIMQWEEKTAFGMEMKGDIIRRDVRQVIVNFFGHHLEAPGASEAETRARIRDLAFKDLVAGALENIVSRKAWREELKEQKMSLQAKLRMLRAGNDLLSSVIQPVEAGNEGDIRTTRQEIARVDEGLRKAVADLETLDDYLVHVRDALDQPESRLRLKEFSLMLDPMNIKLGDDAKGQGQKIDLMEAQSGEQRGVVVIVKYPRAEMLEPKYGLS